MQSLLSVLLPPDSASVGAARRQVRGALVGIGRDDLVDDALLVTSELVTNALLHAGTEIGLEASYQSPGFLVEVTDRSHRVPQPRSYGDEAGTGRGLQLVQSLSDDWGFTSHVAGKTVWFSISRPYADPPEGHPSTADSVPIPSWPINPGAVRDDETVDVHLLNMPLLLHAAWREQAQAMLRDFFLAQWTEGDEIALIQGHAAATDVIGLLDEQVPLFSDGFGHEELISPAVEPEVTLERVTLHVPVDSVAHFASLEGTGERAKLMSEQGALLTPPPLPEVRAFRRWFCRQVLEQALGLAPEPWVMPDHDEAPSAPPHGWDATTVTLSATGLIASDAEGCILAVSGPAATLLGYDDPGELVGTRLVAVVPERFRQAHLAGLTLYLVTGRRPILGRPLTLPALRRDDSEVLVQLTVRTQDVPQSRPVLVAEIRAADESGLLR